MKNKPLIFNIYAALFLMIAISIPVQISVLYGHDLQELGSIFQKLTFFNILVIGISVLNFYYCFSASLNVKWSFPLAIGLICFNNSIVLIYGNDFESYTVIGSTTMFIILSGYFLMTHDTDVMNAPKEHWWRIPKRFSLKEKVKIQLDDISIDIGETFDISSTGAFIPLDEELGKKVKSGKIYTFLIGKSTPIKCRAKIIRKTIARGNYPSGIGIEFEELKLTDKYKLKHKLMTTRLSMAQPTM